MPELPDIELYLHALRPRVSAQPIENIRIISPFLLRSFDPPIETVVGRVVERVERLGKRIVLEVSEELFLVIHLMIAGRLRWLARGARPPGKIGLAAIDFPPGSLHITEASPKKRAALHVIRGRQALRAMNPGGIEPLRASFEEFRRALSRENHTLKRALTDPRLIAGIGNAYGDEILHAARLSPVTLTSRLVEAEWRRLFDATTATLSGWTARLQDDFGERFPGPGEVTAFRPDFAVHGRFGAPCPVCGKPVQRIRYAENETNYCAACQTGGRLLADRSLSRLLGKDWPRTVDELEP